MTTFVNRTAIATPAAASSSSLRHLHALRRALTMVAVAIVAAAVFLTVTVEYVLGIRFEDLARASGKPVPRPVDPADLASAPSELPADQQG